MPHALVNNVILDGPDVQLEGSTELTPDLEHHELYLFITVSQEGVVVSGTWTIPAGVKDWSVTARMGQPGLQPGVVTTTGLTVFQLNEPVSFQTFTWTQNLKATRASEYSKVTS